MIKLTNRWLNPGATAAYSLVLTFFWFLYRWICTGKFTLFYEKYIKENVIAVDAIFGIWLIYVLFRAGHIAGSVVDPHSKLDLESKQQTAFLTGLAIIATATFSIVNISPFSDKPILRELFLVGSGTVVDWMMDRGIKHDNTFIVGKNQLRVRVIEAASDDGLGIMSSAYSHGREQCELPIVLGLASYKVTESEPVLMSDLRPSSFFSIVLDSIDSIFFVRTGEGYWPTIDDYSGDPLNFLLKHKKLGAKVYGGQQNSGTRKELERITSIKRGIATPLECSKQWTELIGDLPTSLNLDAISPNERAVLFGTNFRTKNDNLLNSIELQKLAKQRNWSVVAVYFPRPLLIIGRLVESNYLPPDVCLFLKAIDWHDEGVNLETRYINRWTEKINLLQVNQR